MSAYAVAHLRSVAMGPEIAEYLQRIDATLEPFQGAFRIHGGGAEVLEGTWQGYLIVIEFPDLAARAHGTSPMRIRRSCRCAPTTPKAMRFSCRAFRPHTGRRTFSPGTQTVDRRVEFQLPPELARQRSIALSADVAAACLAQRQACA